MTKHAPYRMPLYPLWPIVGLIALAYVVYTSALDPSLGRPSLIANVVVALLALGYYRFVIRSKGPWTLTEASDEAG